MAKKTYLFRNIAREGIRKGQVPGSAMSRDWYRERARDVTDYKANRLMQSHGVLYQKGTKFVTTSIVPESIGSMVMFFYDPKLKKELPYYDRFPLIFPIEHYSDGFLGINLHYLPHLYRARLMDALYEVELSGREGVKKLQISYQLLKNATKFRYFKPCVKRYLNNHVRSRFLHVPYDEWDVALMLPLERFQKANKRVVWEDSKKIITGIK